MKVDINEKITAYETLIKISLDESWSEKHLSIENAYHYYDQLCGQGKVVTAAKQFMLLKIYLKRAVSSLLKKTKSKTRKKIFNDILLLLELAEKITEIDNLISTTLKIIEMPNHARKKLS